MERYNIFHIIHKGLRAALYQTALQLQQTDFTSEEETAEALNKVREIVMLFDGHAHKEDDFILPAISSYEPSVVASFEAEHEKDEALGKQLRQCLDNIESATGLPEKCLAGKALNETFVSYMVFNLQHMAKEEDVINSILWRYYSDEQIRKIGSNIAKNVEPWIQDFYATWMLRGINTTEAVNWISAIERTAPQVVFNTLLQKAEQECSPRRFRKISETLSKGLQVA